CLARIEAPGPELDDRRGRAADRRAQRVADGTAVEPLGEVTREKDVPGADRRYRLDARNRGAGPPPLPVPPDEGEAPGLLRDEDVAGTEVGDRVESHDEVLVVVELLPHEALCLLLVRRDEVRLGLHAQTERLPLAVEHAADAAAVEVADRVGVEVVLDVARQ